LHLARVPLDGGAPEEVLVMPIAALAGDIFDDLYTPSSPVELGAFGRDIAIGVRLRDSDAFVRVLRLDTAAFE
jgi:hypothetical protein